MVAVIELAPGDEDYIYFRWHQKLACEGSPTISASVWTVPSPLVITDQRILLWNAGAPPATIVTSGGNATRLKVTGFELKGKYTIVNTVTVSDGRKFVRQVQVVANVLSGEVTEDCPVTVS
jgi:hypothetical protein